MDRVQRRAADEKAPTTDATAHQLMERYLGGSTRTLSRQCRP
jgi:hypothetical protein